MNTSYYVIERYSSDREEYSVIWRGFCCCHEHAWRRARIAHPEHSGSLVRVLGPLPPEHPRRVEAAS